MALQGSGFDSPVELYLDGLKQETVSVSAESIQFALTDTLNSQSQSVVIYF